jgi:hypothetical protein
VAALLVAALQAAVWRNIWVCNLLKAHLVNNVNQPVVLLTGLAQRQRAGLITPRSYDQNVQPVFIISIKKRSYPALFLLHLLLRFAVCLQTTFAQIPNVALHRPEFHTLNLALVALTAFQSLHLVLQSLLPILDLLGAVFMHLSSATAFVG